MDGELKILMLEDLPEDAEMVENALRRGGLSFVSKRVDTEENFRRELAEFCPGIVLSDYSLPSFDGLSALKIVKEITPYTPFILVTGAMEDEEAISAVKNGSSDYILKKNLLKLPMAVTRALEEKKARQEHDLAIKALRESENKFRTIFESSTDAVLLLGDEGFFDCNKKTVEMFGLSSKAELNKAHPSDISPPFQPEGCDSLSAANAHIQSAMRDGVSHFEWIHRRRNGEDFPADVLLSAFELGGRKVIQATVRDITERKRAEEALTNSEVRYRRLFESAKDGILILDYSTGIVVDVNPFLCGLLGFPFEQFVGKKIWELGFLTDMVANEAKFLELQSREYVRYDNLPLKTAGNRSVEVEFVSNVYLVNNEKVIQCNIRDNTLRKKGERELAVTNKKLQYALDEVKKTQKMLIRSEKLAALGQLSAGMAHELKNPLNIINAYAQLIMMKKELPADILEYGKIVMEQVVRSVKIIDNLREFAKERKPEKKEIDICPFIEKTLSLVAYEMKGENIEIRQEFAPEPALIMGDEDQLAQVFLNIISNARDSLNNRIKSYTFEEAEKIGWKAMLTIRTAVDDGMVKISFEDNGCGISEENKQKLFTPFFTTKGETKGTGLGMAIAFGIVQNHGGIIDFESEEGKGAIFTVTLPLL